MLSALQTALVTGGCGFVGHHLVNALLRARIDVRVLDNAAQPLTGWFISDVPVYRADVRDAQAVRRILKPADLVVHLAGNSNGSRSVLEPEYDRDVNALGTRNVAEAALDARVGRFIYVSSAAVYGQPRGFPAAEWHAAEPFTPYGKSKLEGERICQELYVRRGLPVVIARPFCIYGSGENPGVALCEVGRYLRWHVNGEDIQIIGDRLKKTRDFVSVKDCVSALLVLAERGVIGQTYNIGTGREISMLKLMRHIEETTGRAAMVTDIPHIQDDTFRLVADISRISNLGYQPRISISDGIRDMLRNPADLAVAPRNMTIFSAGQVAETFPESGPPERVLDERQRPGLSGCAPRPAAAHARTGQGRAWIQI